MNKINPSKLHREIRHYNWKMFPNIQEEFIFYKNEGAIPQDEIFWRIRRNEDPEKTIADLVHRVWELENDVKILQSTREYLSGSSYQFGNLRVKEMKIDDKNI